LKFVAITLTLAVHVGMSIEVNQEQLIYLESGDFNLSIQMLPDASIHCILTKLKVAMERA